MLAEVTLADFVNHVFSLREWRNIRQIHLQIGIFPFGLLLDFFGNPGLVASIWDELVFFSFFFGIFFDLLEGRRQGLGGFFFSVNALVDLIL